MAKKEGERIEKGRGREGRKEIAGEERPRQGRTMEGRPTAREKRACLLRACVFAAHRRVRACAFARFL